MSAGELRVDHEAVAAVARELVEIKAALDAVTRYASEDDLVPAMFGVLGEQMGAGSAFAHARDGLRASFERMVPLLDEIAQMIEDSAKDAVTADEDAVALLNRAAGGLR